MQTSELKPCQIGRTSDGWLLQRSADGQRLERLTPRYEWHDWDLEVDRLVPESKIAELEQQVVELTAECNHLKSYVSVSCTDGATIAALEKQVAELMAKLAAVESGEAYSELRTFIHDVTLHLQKHRSQTDETNNRMFQRAYRLYVKHDAEHHDTAPLPEPAEPEPLVKPDCLKDVPAVLCKLTWMEFEVWVYEWSQVKDCFECMWEHDESGEWLESLPLPGSVLIPLHHDPGAEELREQIEAAKGGEA